MSVGPRPRIVVVEDERIVAEDLSDRLAAMGYEVVAVASVGEDAVAACMRERPDLVLMDIHLQGAIDGITAAARIRDALAVPVVFLTAFSDAGTLQRAREALPYGYVLKPFHERDLRSTLEVALFKHAAERKQRELDARLQDVARLEAVGRLAGGVAHDFNNLLTVVLGDCDLLLADPDLPERRDLIEEIREASLRAAKLTGELMAFGRRQVLHPTPVSLAAAVGDGTRLLRRLLDPRITLRTDFDPGVRVLADLARLHQVISGLCTAARDAMPGGGALTLSVRDITLTPTEATARAVAPGRYGALRVHDTGPAIAPEALPHVFEPFVATRAPLRGGLGLATVYGIVRQSGGDLSVESTTEAGTTFVALFPAADRPAPSEAASVPSAPRGETVLLAEDEDSLRLMFARYLRKLGYRVVAARDGDEALALARGHQGPLDALVTDLQMPRVDGLELAHALLAERPRLAVVLMSGNPFVAHDEIARRKEFDLLGKPFRLEELHLALRKALDRTRPPR